MSNGPTLTGAECLDINQQYININFGVNEIWCTYKGECKKYLLVLHQDEACMVCKYRIPLDIPSIIEEKVGEKNADIKYSQK